MRRLGLALAVLLTFAGSAYARRDASYRYPYSRVWTTAVRLMRIELESPITEKDKDEGYFLFSFAYEGKQYPGSFEVIRQADESGVETARVVVQIAALPSYIELMVLDKLQRKLARDHGAPVTMPSPDKPPNKGGKDDSQDEPADPDASSDDAPSKN